MSEDLYKIDRHIRANNRGFGKLHLVKVGEKVSLCGVTLRHRALRHFARSLEECVSVFLGRSHRYERQNCKRCLQRVQKLRNPLDRLADIQLG